LFGDDRLRASALGFHRLIALPAFLLLLAAPALQWLAAAGPESYRRVALRWLLMLTLVQGVGFQLLYYWRGQQRDFDSGFVTAFNAAAALPNKPVYIQPDQDQAWYVQANWYGALLGLRGDQIVRLTLNASPPTGAVVIGEAANYKCESCRVIKQQGEFIVYVSQ
jgi:hypothetical protein